MKFLTISIVYSVICCIFAPKLKERTTGMKILFPERIEEFSRKHAIRFIGTHSEYDKIKDIKNI